VGQDYAPGAMITKTNPRLEVNLSSLYRYAESEDRVITTREFNQINIPPILNTNLKIACNSSSINLPLTLTIKLRLS